MAMGEKRQERPDDAVVRRAADIATSLAGFRIGPLSIRRTFAGHRPWIGARFVRAAMEKAGLYCPAREDER
jgi:hypothetical protein